MARIIVNGCFDVFHEGHERFLLAAKQLGRLDELIAIIAKHVEWHNQLIVCINSDESAKRLKQAKWGEKYPIDSLEKRKANVEKFADALLTFDTEIQLHQFIEWNMPCILVKGPDYAGKPVTGDDLAPVLILDTPEPESVKEMKKRVYAQNEPTR